MDDSGATKLTGIRQIVRLKEMLQKWQSVTLSPKGNAPTSTSEARGGISTSTSKRLTDTSTGDSDEEGCPSPEPPDVPKGYLAVYVGPELRRFVIPTSHLSHPLFKVLLEKVEEEFGFDHSGGLMIPCEIETFKYLLRCMENQKNIHPGDSSAGDQTTAEA
ncbi:uncharacterized protein LOC116197636 isoform X1 [Punica granatum]|uniref:Uncharacterized protein LOC116197636 isoform X1 n=1 Tax=Punica granatum TaxID=22663 RepID=A0A6P8CHW7_PUNGR|nr:uncharacterized protein LOC116197636 isoform X1 [Punica granatum]XP_031383682.1 uncharacterized protein LOC116197636 isoform X1 [Punica granatum]